MSNDIVIGWIGTPQTVHFLEIVRKSLEELSGSYDIVLHVIGAKLYSNIFNVKCIDWTEDTEAESIQSIDIGIMPLGNGLFERGKCGYKLIQYMACGKSIVASPVGVNEKIVKESNAGYLASSIGDWTRYLGLLCESKTLRSKYGYAARTYVENEYSLQIKLPILADLIIKLDKEMLNNKKFLIISNYAYSLINVRSQLLIDIKSKSVRVGALAPKCSEDLRNKIDEIVDDYIHLKINRSSINPLSEIVTFLNILKALFRYRPDNILAVLLNRLFGVVLLRF